jgi:hypothetical protein
MPDFVYAGPVAMTYPEIKDVYGVPLGTMQPGDAAELDKVPDQNWREYDYTEPGTVVRSPFGTEDKDSGPDISPAAAPSAAPVPAPPAVIPPVS